MYGLAAWGDWHPGVPKGKVVSLANATGRYQDEGKYYEVPESMYGLRWDFLGRAELVVDPRKYPEAKGFPKAHAAWIAQFR